ncbi:hypothetical protein D3C86_1436570 [compost metagenome]
MLSGFLARAVSFAITASPSAPLSLNRASPKTASPGTRRVTPGPTEVTVPEKSNPMARGNALPVTIFIWPLRSFQSMGLMAANATFTATCP